MPGSSLKRDSTNRPLADAVLNHLRQVYIVADIWVFDRRGNVVIPRRSIRAAD